jgi:alkanesulfonate monooxygenase SsuD/methylene tetrahydromethanopterin reductase-like flavin-dependent oxidoreductase (luciferase family)
MLDQMSGGRLELGVGRGISPIEVGFYGADPARGSKQLEEALEVIKKGLISDVLSHNDEFYKFDNVPMVMKPIQRPHPPLWYGIMSAETTAWAAANDVNVVTLMPAGAARDITDRYRAEWRQLGKPAEKLPLLGVVRHMVVSGNAEEAKDAAQRAYRPWRKHLELLPKKYGVQTKLGMLPLEFDELQNAGGAFAGTADGARAYIQKQIEVSGANYFVCDIAFGNLAHSEAMRTVQLLSSEVIPAFADKMFSAVPD